ncbi:EmrB/QacA subfamily drug resistance transporter [Clostridium acetobutylicum]|uniref:Predicted MDR-type permease n=1 Tax=Clostridium acetobutylicum (strain ATCC 824 / DSM 792 / JCM 1419 / IAM 19013 / LMG 5710 / NBRC 13948 / NRRL B-527 / VKM B-1787 / 2291 / W) TaxID=272562 RepID=Q97DK2_CLOAB|nr:MULTISPECIES: MDR family MFS transporter [Clostridium]AAK81401.1 Predicted MDR-type permease [Clostridium acetobutylicum ATCC 824]ADZ22515.1 MDR-type permease [Clostridium acetobutylicum EA 2018]AEI32870.1 MDR-type permease [Clostridium acetobutylicum DSM 1731]AWV80930.1 MFS transporter [Clostridium acetobutylicum]MBC2393747.1 multidrug efflux MFS transporter [Clostridium acetobutylicum]
MKTKNYFDLKKVLPAVLTIAVGMLLVMMDTTIMNVALPHIQSTFNTNLATSQWAITAYTLAMAAVIPYSGWLADRFSAKKIFGIAILFFTIASLLVSISTNIEQVIFYRILQGLSGGIVGPIGIAISFKIIPIEKRGSMMGLLGLPMLLAPTIGPALSGFLIKYYNWHTIFLINIPIGLLSLILVFLFLPNFKSKHNTKIDLRGAFLSPLAFPLLIYGVHVGSDKGWQSPISIISIALGFLMLLTFIFLETKTQTPLLEVKVFKISEFRKGIILMWLNQIAVFGSMLLIPLYLQNIRNYSSLEAGLMMVPQAIASFIGMTVGGRLFDKYGTKSAAIPGFLLTGFSLILLAQITNTTALAYLIICIILLGLGQGLVNMQVNNHALQSVPLNLINRVTPMTNELLQVINSLSIAFITAFLSNQIKTAFRKHSLAVSGNIAFHNTFILLTIFIAIGLGLTFFLKNKKSKEAS